MKRSLSTGEFQIFCGERVLTISADREECFKSINGVGTGLLKLTQLPELFDLFEESAMPEFYIYSETPDEAFKYLTDSNKCIDAAGGIVFNSENKILLMRRRGYRDFPKGKIEKNETEMVAACREIEEECGIKVEIKRKIADTYHIYRMLDTRIIKRTAWFEAKYGGIQTLQPQIEEDITEVRWISRTMLENSLPEMHASLRGLLKLI